MLNNHAEYKYETSFKGPFLITQCLTNGKVILHCGLIKIRHNIRHIKPYKYDTNVEDIKPKNIYDDVNILTPVFFLSFVPVSVTI